MYTNKAQLEEWAGQMNKDIFKKHGYTKVLESKFLHSFYNSFAVNPDKMLCKVDKI